MTPARKRTLAPLLRDPRYEVLPLKHVESAIEALAPGATVTVTSSPAKGQDRTIELAEHLAAQGFHVVPHVAARQVRDGAHLREIIDRCRRAGIWDVFVVGGDAVEAAGAYGSGLELLEALSREDHPFQRIGVPGYPEGHHAADGDTMTKALLDKQAHATYMVTQMCFDAGAISRWLREVRSQRVWLPCYVGIPGAVDAHKLLRVSMKIGIGDSARFLRGNKATVARLLRVRGYTPDGLVRRLTRMLRDGECDIAGFHIYTFNQVERSVRWVGATRSRVDAGPRPPRVRESLGSARPDHPRQRPRVGTVRRRMPTRR